jgi:hypothetical protein
MPDTQTDLFKTTDRFKTDVVKAVPSIVPCDVPGMSDDECLLRLAQAVRNQDAGHLDEIAMLIGRLAVTIE